MNKINWLQRGNEFTKVEGEFQVSPTPPKGLYNITLTLSGWHLERYAEEFTFPHKIYGLETQFIEYVLKTYEKSTGNLGILLNGTKGAGKTVSAKILANKLGLPVIIVKDMGDRNQDLIEFIGGFNFDCVLFFDEFEKNFKEADSTILQVMDGVYNNTSSRRVFLLTTNTMRINENLLSRPSRIRYVKQFHNISQDIVKEYLMDTLETKDCIEDVLAYVDTLEINTIDILKSIVSEINIHGFEEFKAAKKWFNVSVNDFRYFVIRGYIEIDSMETKLKSHPECKNILDLFRKQVHTYLNPPERPNKDLYMNEEEYINVLKEYTKLTKRDFYGLGNYTVESETRFEKLKEGDEFDSGIVVATDKKTNIVMARDDDRSYMYFYYIKNVDSCQVSLYGMSPVLSEYAHVL